MYARYRRMRPLLLLLAVGLSVCAIRPAGAATDPNLDRVSSSPVPPPAGESQQLGDALFSVPEGWKYSQQNGLGVLAPEDLALGQVCRLVILPGADLTGDFRETYTQALAGIRKSFGGVVTDEGVIKPGKSASGLDAFSNVFNFTNGNRDWTCFTMAYRAGSRIEMVFYLVNPQDLYDKYAPAVNRFLAGIRYTQEQVKTQEQPRKATVLADGARPLTQEMVDRLVLVFEWVLDTPTTQEQRNLLTEWAIGAWKENRQTDIESATRMIDAQIQLEKRPDAEREMVRRQLNAKLLEAARQKPDDPGNKWLLQIYDSAHQPIAAGDPPLTRQVSDAYCEVLCFMRNKVAGDEALRSTRAFEDLMASGLAKGYAGASAAWRKHLAGMPVLLAEMRVEWPRMSEADRAKYRGQWRDYLKAQYPELLNWKPAPPPATPAAAKGNETYAQAVARLQRSHQAYVMMSNIQTMRHVANMNVISNIGSSGWRYQYRYVP